MVEETENTAASLRQQVDELRAEAREEAVSLAVDAREQVAALVRRRQDLLADRLGGVAAALRDAGDRLEREASRPVPRAGARPFAAGGGARAATAAAVEPVTLDAGTRGLRELAEQAARQVDRASRYLRRSEPRDLLHDLEDLARRRPAAFVGGSFATGLLLARFFRSSGERASWPASGRPAPPPLDTAGPGAGDQRTGELAGRW